MNANWPTYKLRDIADVRVSNVDKKTSHAETPVKLCNYMDVYANDYVTKSIDFMAASASKSEIERFCLQAGDVIITKDSETPDDIGVPAVVTDSIDGLVCGYHLALIRPRSDVIDSIYLAKQLSTAPISRYFASNASGSTRFGLPISVIEDARIPVASKPEQKKIAEFLFTVDRAIEQTEALIAKQPCIKTGLMQDLLTQGIDEHGNLRSEKTHQFKDSPLGRIPVEWDVWNIDSISDFVTSGARGWAKHYSDEGALFLRIGNLTRDHINMRFDDTIFVRPPAGAEGLRTVVAPGDILISVTADLGLIGAIPEDFGEGYVNQHIALVRISDPEIDQRFIGWFLHSRAGQIQIEKHNESGAKAGLNLPTIGKLLVASPPPCEQRRIARVLDANANMMSRLQAELNKQSHLKASLMQDLLTGKCRVTSLSLSRLISQAKDLSIWLHEKTNDRGIPNERRSQTGLGLLQHSLDVADAIIILLENKLPGPALALARPLFESYVRAIWILKCASDEQITQFLKGQPPPRFPKLLGAMEEQAIPQADFIRKVHDLHMRHFHDFTHGGSGHVMRRHGENAVEPNYPLNEQELLVSLGIEMRIRVGVEIFLPCS